MRRWTRGCAELHVTAELDIRAYAGVPIRLSDRTVYGTLCAYSRSAKPMDPEDVYALQLAAGLIANRLELLEESERSRVEDVPTDPADGGTLRMVFQPIVTLTTGEVRGYEALARFDHEPLRNPDDWFALAGRLGLNAMLQRQAAAKALAMLDQIPPDRYLAINLNDAALIDEDVQQMLAGPGADRLTIELTEHDSPDDLTQLQAAVALLRSRGSRLALDDVGTGYAGLTRVLDLEPDMIKLDRRIIGGVATDRRRQAMVQAFTTYGRAVGAVIVAEGIETQADVDALRILGVDKGQSFLLGRPSTAPWEELFPG
jgi:EAL domain-containing protein (putative c-di-GMP-specific phosphodiesterase class I)